MISLLQFEVCNIEEASHLRFDKVRITVRKHAYTRNANTSRRNAAADVPFPISYPPSLGNSNFTEQLPSSSASARRLLSHARHLHSRGLRFHARTTSNPRRNSLSSDTALSHRGERATRIFSLFLAASLALFYCCSAARDARRVYLTRGFIADRVFFFATLCRVGSYIGHFS